MTFRSRRATLPLMESLRTNPTFVVYALTCVVLSLNLIVVWAFSGIARGKTKTAVNKEDAERFGASLVPLDPPEVARVLRAHANAQAMIYPFLFLGLVYVLAGGTPRFGLIVFGGFAVTRIAHSIAYLAGKQPWRTLFFTLGGVPLVALIGQVTWMALHVPTAP